MATLGNKIIYLGRGEDDNRLHIIVTDKNNNGEGGTARMGEPNSVDKAVSRCKKNSDGSITAHCMIEIDSAENMLIKNLKEANSTYVDGDQILQRAIDENSIIELGKGRYKISMSTILLVAKKVLNIVSETPKKEFNHTPHENQNKNLSETVSIKHLERVWIDYHDGILELKKRNKRTQTNRMMLMMIGSGIGSMICGLITSQQSFDPGVAAIFTALPSFIIGGSIFWLMANDNSIEEEDRISNSFAKDYVCPCCGRHLGKIAYEHLPQQLPNCPKCKKEFTF